ALVALVVARLLSPPPPPPASRPPTPAAQPPASAGSAASEAKHPTAVDLGPDATIPKTRAGKLRALRALGATPIMRPDGKTDYSAKEVIEALRAAGRHDGIAAFEPPGTVPVKLGLVVPDDFELPEGYIRYIQTTDDGRRLPPILMFHPDYRF